MAQHPKSKCQEEECECPEWIFTFADLVMLMMGFFVILWVLKPAPGKPNAGDPMDDNWKALVAKIREAFDYMPDPKSTDPIDQYMILKKLEQIKPMKGQGEGGKTMKHRDAPPGTDAETTALRPGKHVTIGGRVPFDAGSVELNDEARRTLDEIVKVIQGYKIVFMVKGHTASDDAPADAPPIRRMEISLKRAQAVADYLAAHGINPEVMRVQGCSTFEPVAQRAYTADIRNVNRRVEVETTDRLTEEGKETPPATAPVSFTGHD